MISVNIQKKFQSLISSTWVVEALGSVCTALSISENSDLSILITTDEKLRRLNKAYLGIDRPTDVLSFESGAINPETGNSCLGDIAISFPMALKQSIFAGHPLQNELALLMTHAVLHLCGFDHDTQMNKSAMWKKQHEILHLLGYSINSISGDQE